MANYVSKIRAEFDARQATEAMYALSERARSLNKLLADQKKRWEEASDYTVKEAIEGNIKRLEREVESVEKLNRIIEKATMNDSAFEQVLKGDIDKMSVARLETAQRNARAIMRNINPEDARANTQMSEAQQVMNTAGKQLASLKNGFTDAFKTFGDGINGKALPELKRLEAALTEAQKFSTDKAEWNKYQEAIGKVRLEIQSATKESVLLEEQSAKVAVSLKYGFDDAFGTFEKGIDGMALPELKRLEAALVETQKYSVDATEWQKYGEAIDKVRAKVQGITGEYLSVEQAMGYAEQIGKQTFTGTIADLERAKKLLTDYRKSIKQTGEGAEELKQVDRNLEIIEAQIKGTYMTTEKFNEILKAPKGKSFDELKAAIEQAEKQLYGMRRETDEERKAFVQLKEQIDGAKEELKDFGEAQENTGIGMDDLKDKVKQLAGAYLGLQSFQKVWQMNLDLSDQMAAVRKTTGMTEDEVARLTERIKDIDSRAANEQLMALAATAGQLGLQSEEAVLGFTKAANQITVSLDELGTDGVLQLMKVSQVSGALDAEMGDVEQTLLKVGSSINELSAASSATAGPITDFIGRVGGVASTAKMTMAQIAALGATTDALAISAELAGTQINVFIGGMQKNTKAVADLLGTSKEAVQSMLDNGRAMDLFVEVVEKMGTLNANKLEDFLKEMGSSGSRATQVFSTLSQNVDQLRANLQVSYDAYEKGISITEEYNKVNDTAAGKFERLKNQISEAFMSDGAQKSLGWIIDRLRDVTNLLTGNVAPALDLVGIMLKTLLIRWAIVKAEVGKTLLLSLPKAIATLRTLTVTAFATMGTQIKAAAFYMGVHTMATKRAAVAMRQLNAAQMANFWVALAAAIAYAAKALYDWSQRVSTTVSAMANAEKEITATTHEVNNLFGRYQKLDEKQTELNRSTKSLKDREAELRKELEALRKKMGEGAEQSEEYKKKQEELERAHKKVAEAEGEAAKATNERLGLINEINSKYSTYLGYMLSEASTAETVASAHDLIIAALKEEMYWREKTNAFKTVTEKHSEDLNKYMDKSMAELNGIDEERQQNIMSAWQAQLSQVTYDAKQGGFTLTPGGKAYATVDQALEGMKERFNTVLVTEGGYYMVHTDDKKDRLNDWWGGALDDGFRDWTKESLNILKEASMLQSMSGSAATKAHEAVVREAQTNTDALIQQASQEGASNRQMAEAVVGIQKNLSKYGELAGNYQQFAADTSLQGIANVLLKDLPADTRKAVEDEMQRVSANGVNQPSPTPTTPIKTTVNGGANEGSTVYNEMSADQLKSRTKQMREFVGSIGSDADVQSLLKEDPALKKAIEKGMSNDMQTVINWYNDERLKIQDELHRRHLSNSGNFQDPKQQKAAHKQFKAELDAYLEELDAYYTQRKAEIERARTDEEITEGEAWRRNLKNENEWYNRRAELLKIYAEKSGEVTEAEQEAIVKIIADRTGESEKFVRAMIQKTIGFAKQVAKTGEKGAAMYHDWMADIDLKTQQSMLKSHQAITKQMKFIEDTLAKERPYDGITKNLQDNLDKMGVLAARMRRINDEMTAQGKQPQYSNADITAQSYKEVAFLLDNAADAWSIDIDELLQRMVKEGMEATAEEIGKSDMLKQAVMGQLRKTYQEVQDAVKKEASQIKKDVEIIWNDEAQGIGGQSMKSVFDQAIARLGMQQDSVSRANSLIGAGAASDNVATRLAIKQIEVQMRMQKAQFDMYRTQANQRMAMLRAEAEEHERIAKQMKAKGDAVEYERAMTKKVNALRDAENVKRSLGLTLAEETKKEEEQMAELLKLQEESQNRLYTSLREWADLLTSSLQGVMEASHAGDAEYYNERAKLDLTGKGGPGAGTYIVIDNEGTSDARAHYEYLDERQALERQHEIERENAQAEAWKKLWDDLNAKMSEQITDWMNAALQDAATKDNTSALLANTEAIYASIGAETGETQPGQPDAIPAQAQPDKPSAPVEPMAMPGSAPAPAGSDAENTSATNANTVALNTLTQVLTGQSAAGSTGTGTAVGGETTATVGGDVQMPKPFFQMSEEEKAAAMETIGQMWQTYNEGGVAALQEMAESLAAMEGVVLPPWQITEEGLEVAMERMGTLWQTYAEQGIAAMQQMSDAMEEMPNKIPDPTQLTEERAEQAVESATNMYQGLGQVQIQAQQDLTDKVVEGNKQQEQSTKQKNKQQEQSTKSTYSAMTAAMNMYGTAYQIMSNDNMDMTQKFQMFALQAAGQTAIGMLTTNMLATDAQGKVELPGILGKAASQLGPIAGPIAFAAMTALLGGLMAVAMSSVSKSKSQIAQVTGASASAGRLSTGMMTYKEGNVNEFTDPASLTPGRSYNVDGADGKTYRARYMGKGAKTHITSGPEFHLVGEAGREAIIDAKTTRQIQMDEPGIWHTIQTLYNGGSVTPMRRRSGRGVRAFADGNIDDFEEVGGDGLDAYGTGAAGGMSVEQMAAFQSSLDRNNELLERALTEGIEAFVSPYGKRGIVNGYDTYKKEAQRYGVDY